MRRISVIVPVFADPKGLQRCLRALATQSIPQADFEVIVVDNGDNGRLAADDLPANARLVAEATPSSYAARNRGLAVAQGEVIAFTDADCEPYADWLERGVACLDEDAHRGLVGGAVIPTFACPTRPTAAELYSSVIFHRQEKLIAERHFAVGANLFTRRTVFDRVGMFDARLRSGGDREWGERIARHGYEIAFAPGARVGHPALHTLGALRRKAVRVLGGELQRRRADGYGLGEAISDTYRDLVTPVSALRVARREARLRSWQDTSRFVIAATVARYARILERVRLLSGGEPRRA